MAESFAGITVPEGEPGELRSAARSLSTLSHELGAGAGQLSSLPSALSGWMGPASVAYTGSCQIASDGVRASATAMEAASTALAHFGERLKAIQDDAPRDRGRTQRAAAHRPRRARDQGGAGARGRRVGASPRGRV